MHFLRTHMLIAATVVGGIAFFLLIAAGLNPDITVFGFIAVFVLLSFIDDRLLFVGWFVIAPYYVSSGVEGGANIASNLSHNIFVPAITIVSLVLLFIRKGRISFGREDLFLLLFFAYTIVSSYIATKARYDDVRMFYLIYLVPWFLYVLVKNMHMDLRLIKWLAYASIFHLIVLTLLAGYEYSTGGSLYAKSIAWNDVGRGRITGPFGSPIIMGVFVPINFLFVFLGYKFDVIPRYAMRFFALLAGLLTILTFTRSVWLGAFIAFIYIMYRTGENFESKILQIAGFMGVAVTIVTILFFSSDDIHKRLGGEENANFRIVVAEASLNMIADKPLTGWGAGMFDEFSDRYLFDARGVYILQDTSHVTLLTIVAELGVVGTSLILMFLFFTLSFKGIQTNELSLDERMIIAVSMGGIIIFLINAFLIDMRFYSLSYCWFFVNLGFVRNIYLRTIAFRLNEA